MRSHRLSDFPLRSSRLTLFPTTLEIAIAARDDRAALARLLNARIPEEWPQDLFADTLDWAVQKATEHPDEMPWWVWYWVRHDPSNERVLIGNGGFKGPRNDAGAIEVGYGILEPFQRNGYATEAVRELVDWALAADPAIRQIAAETYPHLLPSIGVMEKLDMQYEGPGAGEGVVRYSVDRDRWQTVRTTKAPAP